MRSLHWRWCQAGQTSPTAIPREGMCFASSVDRELSIFCSVRHQRACCTGSPLSPGQPHTLTPSLGHKTTPIRLNGGVKMIEQPAPKITHLLTPNSPLSSRRGSSPLPVGHTHRGTGRKKGESLPLLLVTSLLLLGNSLDDNSWWNVLIVFDVTVQGWD